MSAFVERTLQAVLADGTSFDMPIRIGQPRPFDVDCDWRCSLSIGYLFDKPRDLVGIDSWQALQMALDLTAQLLQDFVDRGGRLFLFDEPLQPAALFVRLTR